MTDTRHIRQTFHRASGLELRSTWQSTQAYKRHSHPQLSIGAIMDGQTCCICHDKEYILNPGDLIVIPASAPHSCNPVMRATAQLPYALYRHRYSSGVTGDSRPCAV